MSTKTSPRRRSARELKALAFAIRDEVETVALRIAAEHPHFSAFQCKTLAVQSLALGA